MVRERESSLGTLSLSDEEEEEAERERRRRPMMTILVLFISVFFMANPSVATRPLEGRIEAEATGGWRFAEAPHFRNGEGCAAAAADTTCDPSFIHVAMTLDACYLRGSIAAVHSVLWHASCPDLVFLHFIALNLGAEELAGAVRASFPALRFQIHSFRYEDRVRSLVSPSIREALDQPLNYARAYLADLLDPCVERVIYLDSDLVVVDDIERLWSAPALDPSVLAAPVYCSANFTRYFTPDFWRRLGARVFEGRRHQPCYFNTGVMVIDLRKWRSGGYTKRIEDWMKVHKRMRIYELGSLPPFLLEFAGEVEEVEQRWNQHGLGGDNARGRCRNLHPGPVSLLHWSGKGKPWDRLDAGEPCAVDRLWKPYDLYVPKPSSFSPSVLSW